MIELKDLQKVIDGRTVIDIPELKVESGEIAAVIGPAGSGKDTLLSLLTGEKPPTIGMLRLMGAVRHKLLAEAHAPEAHKPLFEALIDGGLLAHIRRNNKSGINALLAEVLGEGYDYDELLQAEEHAAIHGADGD